MYRIGLDDYTAETGMLFKARLNIQDNFWDFAKKAADINLYPNISTMQIYASQ